MTIKIDRSIPFNPDQFLPTLGWRKRETKGWRIIEEDNRSLQVAEIELDSILFRTFGTVGDNLHKRWQRMTDKRELLKHHGDILLDAKILQALWMNKELIPETWKDRGIIDFDGTLLMDPSGTPCVLHLWWFNNLVDKPRWSLGPKEVIPLIAASETSVVIPKEPLIRWDLWR